MQNTDKNGIELLGQKINYPKTTSETIGFVAILLAIVGMTYIISVKAKTENLGTVGSWWNSATVNASGKTVPFKDRQLIQFWTPSERTKQSKIHDKWEENASEQRNIDFGNAIKKDNRVLGYRRHEVYGHGRTDAKWGWWWSVTASHDYTPEDLMKVYSTFWNSNDSVYIEITHNGGEYRISKP